MSIASEITRLQTAKADLKTAIEGKGVTVAASATLDDYADLVDAIETGGGGGSVPHVEAIDYTPAVNTQTLSIPLSFTNPPLCIYIYLDTEPNSPSVATVSSIRLQNKDVAANSGTVTLAGGNRRTNDIAVGGGRDYWSSTPEGTIAHDTIDISVANKGLYFGAGLTYHIIAIEVAT